MGGRSGPVTRSYRSRIWDPRPKKTSACSAAYQAQGLEVGVLGQVARGDGREAEERVAGGVRQAPVGGQLGTFTEPEVPGQRVRGRRGPAREVTRRAGRGERDGGRGLVERALDGRPGREGRVEPPGELGRHRVVDRLVRGDDRRCARLDQPDHLGAGRAAIEEDEPEPAPAAEEGGQPAGGGDHGLAQGRLEQQAEALGVSPVMEDGDAVAIPGVLERVHHVGRGGVLPDDHLAEPRALGRLEGLAQSTRLLRQVPEVAASFATIVGECQDDHRPGLVER